MKRKIANPFAAFFSNSSEKGEPSRKVLTTLHAQPNVLQEKMAENQLTHGETVLANLSPVRLEIAYGKMRLYFCPLQTLEVLKTIKAGDGGMLPDDVVVEGLRIPVRHCSGLYTLKNVKLSSNGKMQVIANADTTWEPV